jgi:hypothetical protein
MSSAIIWYDIEGLKIYLSLQISVNLCYCERWELEHLERSLFKMVNHKMLRLLCLNLKVMWSHCFSKYDTCWAPLLGTCWRTAAKSLGFKFSERGNWCRRDLLLFFLFLWFYEWYDVNWMMNWKEFGRHKWSIQGVACRDWIKPWK